MTILSKKNQFLHSSNEAFSGYVLMAPTFLIMGVFLVLPIILAMILAFYRIQPLGDVSYTFRGWRNFLRVFNDERVIIALKNTAEYVAIVVPTQTLLALSLALILNTQIKGKNFFRILFFLPTVTSSAVLTLIFMWICNSNGLLNRFLEVTYI